MTKQNITYKKELLNYIEGCKIRITDCDNSISNAKKEIELLKKQIKQRQETKRLALIQIKYAQLKIKNIK